MSVEDGASAFRSADECNLAVVGNVLQQLKYPRHVPIAGCNRMGEAATYEPRGRVVGLCLQGRNLLG